MAGERFEQQILDRLVGPRRGHVPAPVRRARALLAGRRSSPSLFGGRLYLKVDERSKGDYLARGMGPFRPNERQTLKSYYEVPPEVLADPEALLSWAREAIRAGMDSQNPVR